MILEINLAMLLRHFLAYHCAWVEGNAIIKSIIVRLYKFIGRRKDTYIFCLILEQCNFKFIKLLNSVRVVIDPRIFSLACRHLRNAKSLFCSWPAPSSYKTFPVDKPFEFVHLVFGPSQANYYRPSVW